MFILSKWSKYTGSSPSTCSMTPRQIGSASFNSRGSTQIRTMKACESSLRDFTGDQRISHFQFLYQERWEEKMFIKQKMLVQDNSTIHSRSHYFIKLVSKHSQTVHNFLRNLSSFSFAYLSLSTRTSNQGVLSIWRSICTPVGFVLLQDQLFG